MKIACLLFIVVSALAGCSSRSDEAYQRLFQLAGIKANPAMQRIEFIKTSGMDPYYLAKIEVPSTVSPADIFQSLGEWENIADRFVSAPSDITWWRPGELHGASVWAPKKNEPPSYTEVVLGQSGAISVIYVAWQKHAHF
jgi:hypothetical protein